MEQSNFYYMMRTVLLQLPSLLAIIGCMVFAIVRWQRYPSVSLRVAISLALLLVHALFFAFVFAFVPDWVKPGAGLTTPTLISILAFIYHSLLAGALAILLSAVYMRRNASVPSCIRPT